MRFRWSEMLYLRLRGQAWRVEDSRTMVIRYVGAVIYGTDLLLLRCMEFRVSTLSHFLLADADMLHQ